MNTRLLVERTAALPHYETVRQAWENSCVEFMVGELDAAIGPTIGELEQWRLLWMLQHLEGKRAFQMHLKLIASKAMQGDLEFLEVLSAHRHSRRGRPKEPKPLGLIILSSWLSAMLWTLSNQERSELISHRFGRPGTTSEAVGKCSQRLGLLGWEKLRSNYPEAPLHYKRYRGLTDEFVVADPWTKVLNPKQP
jgi:hypothetical protein